MERKQIYIADEQEEALKRIARSRKTTVSAVIRDAVDKYIADELEVLDQAEQHPLWAIVGVADDPNLPLNGSVEPDEIVYETRRRARRKS